MAMTPLYGKDGEHGLPTNGESARTKLFSAQQTVFALHDEMGFTPTTSIGVQSMPTVMLRQGRMIPRDCMILLASAEKGWPVYEKERTIEYDETGTLHQLTLYSTGLGV